MEVKVKFSIVMTYKLFYDDYFNFYFKLGIQHWL